MLLHLQVIINSLLVTCFQLTSNTFYGPNRLLQSVVAILSVKVLILLIVASYKER